MSRRIDVRTYDERVCARMLRVGERAMDGDRRVRILLLLDRAAAPLKKTSALTFSKSINHRM